jgi:metal-responsive CopG/Arc/MetJ family transcriptional regulator
MTLAKLHNAHNCTSFSLPPEMAKELRKICDGENITRSQFIRKLIQDYIESQKETVK